MQPLQKSRLGRGLASLIGEPQQRVESSLPAEGEQRLVPIDLVRAGRLNPRKDFREEELADLALSIRQKGVVQPIVVRPDPASGGYEIVAGERRWRAAQRAQLHQVPVIVRELSDQDALEIAIIENVQRADLNAIEEAGGYRELMERFGYTQDQLAEVIGKSRAHLANTLRLLKLPQGVQELVRQGTLTAGHARTLVGREDAEKLAQQIIERGLNVREAELLAKGEAAVGGVPANTNTARQPREKDPDTRAFEKELTDVLGLKVEIKRGSGESGVLSVKYGNFDQLDYIRKRLSGGE
jgi:ParB family chromosome partitioning protein